MPTSNPCRRCRGCLQCTGSITIEGLTYSVGRPLYKLPAIGKVFFIPDYIANVQATDSASLADFVAVKRGGQYNHILWWGDYRGPCKTPEWIELHGDVTHPLGAVYMYEAKIVRSPND